MHTTLFEFKRLYFSLSVARQAIDEYNQGREPKEKFDLFLFSGLLDEHQKYVYVLPCSSSELFGEKPGTYPLLDELKIVSKELKSEFIKKRVNVLELVVSQEKKLSLRIDIERPQPPIIATTKEYPYIKSFIDVETEI